MVTDIIIPNSVTTIGEFAFCGCGSLTSVTIPDSVTSIGISAFEICPSLTEVIIGDNVTKIDNTTFAWCESLASVTIGSGVTTIDRDAFAGCQSLTDVKFETTGGVWYVSQNEGATSGTIVDHTNTKTVAEYLKDTYYDYFWYHTIEIPK